MYMYLFLVFTLHTFCLNVIHNVYHKLYVGTYLQNLCHK